MIEQINNEQIIDGFNPVEKFENMSFEAELALNDVEVASETNNKKLANSLEYNSIGIDNI